MLLLGVCAAGASAAGCGEDAEERQKPANSPTPISARVVDYDRPEGPVARDGLLVIDPATGDSAAPAAPGFSGGDAQFALVPSSDQIAYRCSRGACVTSVESDSPEARLGDAWCIAPSVRPNHVWLAVLDPESPATERAITSVSEVSFAGEIQTGPSILPERRWHCPVGAFDGGLLFQEFGGIAAWDAKASNVIATIPDIFPAATHETVVATYPDEGERRLRLTELTTGDVELIEPPPDWRFDQSYEGDFSPDGSRLAVTATRSDASEREGGLAVVDLSTGSTSTVRADWSAGVAWAPDGTELYVATLGHEGRYETAISVYDPELNLLRKIETGLGVLELESPRALASPPTLSPASSGRACSRFRRIRRRRSRSAT
jgi:hypothetical protein